MLEFSAGLLDGFQGRIEMGEIYLKRLSIASGKGDDYQHLPSGANSILRGAQLPIYLGNL